jgi:uncharacterized membrane protein
MVTQAYLLSGVIAIPFGRVPKDTGEPTVVRVFKSIVVTVLSFSLTTQAYLLSGVIAIRNGEEPMGTGESTV